MQLPLYCKSLRTRTINLKTLLAMKVTSLLLFAACLHAGAKGYSQQITISLKNAPIETVFKQIEAQTDYRFIYSEEAIQRAHPVSIDVRHESIENLLKLCFYKQPLNYKVDDKIIVVKEIEEVGIMKIPLNEVRGRVVNEKGEPLVGATIKIKSTGKGTSTNNLGEFLLKNVNESEVLVITSVGYYKEEIPISKPVDLLITLRIAIEELEETVIKGYYATSKKLNTGAVSKIGSKEIINQPVSNPLATLQGRIPGLIITQANGLPGSNFTVRIRGQNSIQNGNSPLYIVDGVPFANESDLFTQRSGINASSPFNTIDPSEIESIEVLKDADATSIYGSRGANGVIIITSKRGKAGKTQANINVYSGWGKVTRTMNYMNLNEYLSMRHEAFTNDGIAPTTSNAYDLLVWDTTRYTDLKKILIGGTAHSENVNAKISGGNLTTQFEAGVNYYKESTVFPGNKGDRRIGANLFLSHHSSNDKLSLTISNSFTNDKSDLYREDLTQFVNLTPVIPELFDSIGQLIWRSGGYTFNNPMANTLRSYIVATDKLTSNAVIQYIFSKQFKAQTSFGYNQFQVQETDKVTMASQDPAFSPTGSAFFGNNSIKTWVIEPQLDYSIFFGNKGKIVALAGLSWQQTNSSRSSINGFGYTNDNLLNSTVGAQSIISDNGEQLYHYSAGYARLNLDWDEKYLINLTGRRDGSSRFGPGRQFANFGAVGLGWVFSGERFVRDHIPILSFGKLRASYGITGNDLIGNYQYLNTYSTTAFGYQGNPALFPSKLYNPNYSWEQIRKLDIGIELVLLGDRFMLTTDWFQNKSDNQIINYTLPSQTGFSTVLQNFPGKVQNRGFEFELKSIIIRNKDITWSSEINLTHNQNKLISFPNLSSSSYSSRYLIGKSLNSIIGATFAGVDPITGVYQFYNQTGLLSFTTTQSDYNYQGTTDPSYFGGFQNTFVYKKLELQFLFEYKIQKGRHPIYSITALVGDINNQPTKVLNRWRKAGDTTPYQKYTTTYTAAGIAGSYLVNSSAILTDASYARLKNLSLSWNIESKKLKKSGIEKLRLYSEAQNLFVITSYDGFDPETQSIRSLPPLKMIATGIQITF